MGLTLKLMSMLRLLLSLMLMPRLPLRLMSMLILLLSLVLMSRFPLSLTSILPQLLPHSLLMLQLLMPLPQLLMLLTLLLMPLPQLLMLDTLLLLHTLDTDTDMPQLLTQHWLLPQLLLLLKLPYQAKTKDYIQ